MHNDTTPVPLTVAEMAARVETLLAGFDRVATPREAREGAEALVRTIVSLYGSGLERVLEIVHEASDDRSGAVFAKLVEDPFVESLLCLHGLHPVGLAERVQAALDSVRPYLKSHEGDVAIDGSDGDGVLLRLEGSCDGCPSSTATIELAVERAILERVPEIREVRALGLAPPLATTQSGRSLKIESDWILWPIWPVSVLRWGAVSQRGISTRRACCSCASTKPSLRIATCAPRVRVRSTMLVLCPRS